MSDVADMDVTVQGTAVLLRQALECAAIDSWLVGSNLLLAERGFAALWQNLDERSKFPDAAGYSYDPALDAQQVADLLAFGRQEGVLNEAGDGPRKKIVGNTDACKMVTLDPERFGTTNAEAHVKNHPTIDNLMNWYRGAICLVLAQIGMSVAHR